MSPPKPGGRIGEKLNELEQVRLRSNSVSDVQLPKVDIHKRRSLFEVVESAETHSPSAERVARDLGGAKIVKARLSSLERRPETVEKLSPRITDEVSLTLKDRLSNLEKQKTSEPVRRVSNGDLGHISIKERLSSLEKGFKESVNSSDEEINQKDLLSPAVSDREVSSPLVSPAPEDGGSTDGDTNQGSEVVTNGVVMGLGSCEVPKEPVEEISETKREPKPDSLESNLVDSVALPGVDHDKPLCDDPLVASPPGPIKIAKSPPKAGKKPPVRTRKLTPMNIPPISPTVKSPTDLQIISEDEQSGEIGEHVGIIAEDGVDKAPRLAAKV